MESAIFDTSVWVNFSKGKTNAETDLLEKYIIQTPWLIYITPTILQEFLMGSKAIFEYRKFEEQFLALNCIKHNWIEFSLAASKLYFDLRKKGVTIRKSTDCLIAQVAIQNDFLLVHNDSDFELIAENSPLRTFK